MAIKYEIIKKLGTLSTSTKGWKKDFNLVSWNEREAKFDLREWSDDYSKMSKGITLTKEEVLELKEILNNLDI